MHEGVMDVLKIMQQSNLQLTAMADRKGGILLGANIILVSILMGHFVHKGSHLIFFPPLLLSFAILIFSIKALAPKLSLLKELPPNIMFFKEVAQCSYSDYLNLVTKKLEENQEIYAVMINNIYQTSLILNNKFRNILICYNLCYLFFIYWIIIFLLGVFKIIHFELLISGIK